MPTHLRVGGPEYYRLRPDSDIGGEVYERMLLERLPAHGVDVVLGLPKDHGAGDLAPGVTADVLRHGPGLHWLAAPVVLVPYVIRLLRRGRVDLLRGHSVRYCGPSLLLGRAAVRAGPGRASAGVPIVLHHHHFFPRWRALEAAILRRADAVVTVSEYSRLELLAAGVHADRVHVVLDGVARPPQSTPCPELWPGPGLRLLHVGRLEPRKRPSVVLAALGELRRQGVPATLLMAGDGPQRSELLQHVNRAGLADCVRFLGRVSEQLKWQLYDSAELLLFASALEGFGLVVAEAQSRGLPVVAAEGTASSEALEPGLSGLLASPSGPAFAAAVMQLADPARRLEMSARAADFARRFDWDVCAAEVAQVYVDLAAR